MKIRIEPYKRWSGGARALGKRCGILRATPKQVQKHGDFDYIINWGSNERKFNGTYVNNPEAVRTATSKLETAQCLGNHGVPQPEYTTDSAVADTWIHDGETVVCRTLLRAQGGRGIVLASTDSGNNLANAPLYTKYFKKAEEYRVHVVGGKVIDVQMKKKRQEVPNEQVNYQIRNSDNGWVYCRGGVNAPTCVTDAAVRAVSALGLDFGAADIGYNVHGKVCAVFEVNTAPGIEGTTCDKYFEALQITFPCLKGGMYKKRRAG